MTESWSCVNTNFYGRNKVKSMESLADKVGLNFPEKGTKRLGNISKLEISPGGPRSSVQEFLKVKTELMGKEIIQSSKFKNMSQK